MCLFCWQLVCCLKWSFQECPHVSVLLASFKICLYKLSREEKTGHFSLLAVGVLSEMELSRCLDDHSSNIVQILFKVPRLTKTKSAKFVSDEQREAIITS